MSDRELREALRRAGERPDPAARERAWRVVQAAYSGYEPRRSRLRWARPATLAAVLAVLVGGAVAAAATTRGGIREVVHDVLGIGEPHARPALVRVPGGGRLLVQAGASSWVVAADGSRRRLGAYDGASWSPRGLFVVAWRGRVLTAVEPSGQPRWSLSRPRPIDAARWSPGDGFRIAYLSGGSLRVVNGDGTGDRRYGGATSVAPAWRPGAAHVLAYVDAKRRVEVTAVDTRRRLWRSSAMADPVALAWSSGGGLLLVLKRDRAVVYDAGGHHIASQPIAGVQSAAWSPRAREVALVRTDAAAGTSSLVLLNPAHPPQARTLFSGPGTFGAPTWAPDGRSVLLPWPDAGQWLFLRPRGSRRTTAVANIARQFSSGPSAQRFPDDVAWCCGRAQP
jgi:hypothetical protein